MGRVQAIHVLSCVRSSGAFLQRISQQTGIRYCQTSLHQHELDITVMGERAGLRVSPHMVHHIWTAGRIRVRGVECRLSTGLGQKSKNIPTMYIMIQWRIQYPMKKALQLVMRHKLPEMQLAEAQDDTISQARSSSAKNVVCDCDCPSSCMAHS